MPGSSAISPKDRKIRSTLWVPPAERHAQPILEVGLASADMDPSILDVLSDDIMGLIPGQITVQPRFQNNAKLDILRDMMGVLSEKVEVKSEMIKILSEKEAALAEKMDILSKMLDSVS